MKQELGFKEILLFMLIVGAVCFFLGFLSGCFPPERKQFWKDVQASDPNYGAGRKP